MNEAIERVINSLRNGDLDEAIKTANEEVTTTEDEKTAEAALDPELVAVVTKVLEDREKQAHYATRDKVDVLVDETNEEAEKLAEQQENILTGIFNETCIEEGEMSAEDITKVASEEDSMVPYLMEYIYKYAEIADNMLGEKYDEDYDEGDVVKLATVLINSVEDPFELEALQAYGEEVQEDEVSKTAEEVLNKLKSGKDAETLEALTLEGIKSYLASQSE